MNLEKLKDEFTDDQLEWRIGRSGIKNGKIWATALVYITSRALHDRLDEVCEPQNWQLVYKEHLGGTICGIGIRCDMQFSDPNNKEWIWKWGGAESTKIEAFKGGLSSAEKRAGVPWNIARYLYKFEEVFVLCSLENNSYPNYSTDTDKQTKKKTPFWWKTPLLEEIGKPLPKMPNKQSNDTKPKRYSETISGDVLKYYLEICEQLKQLSDGKKEVAEEILLGYGGTKDIKQLAMPKIKEVAEKMRKEVANMENDIHNSNAMQNGGDYDTSVGDDDLPF